MYSDNMIADYCKSFIHPCSVSGQGHGGSWAYPGKYTVQEITCVCVFNQCLRLIE